MVCCSVHFDWYNLDTETNFKGTMSMSVALDVCCGGCWSLAYIAATSLNGLYHWNPLVFGLGGICFLLDTDYFALPIEKRKQGGL